MHAGLEYQGVPDVGSAPNGDFAVIWTSYGQDGAYGGAFARRFDASGMPQGPEFQVNTLTVSYQYGYNIAFQSDGDFIVVWSHDVSGPSDQDLFARRFDSTGAPQGGEVQIHNSTVDNQTLPDITVAGDDDFIVVWGDQDGGFGGIFGRRFDSAGNAQGFDFQVNAHTMGDQHLPAVTRGPDGDFVVVWRSFDQDGSDSGIFARRFDSAGTTQGGDLQVNTYTTGLQNRPDISSDGAGGFLVAWESDEQDASGSGVFGQRLGLSTLAILDVDGDGMTAPLTDGLLFLRFGFGFTGATLVNGAVGGGCTRCTGAAVAAYLNGLGDTLDIDGDTSVEPLTDGLLALRFGFGFTGTTLTSGAVGAGCSRCDAAAIAPYLQSLT